MSSIVIYFKASHYIIIIIIIVVVIIIIMIIIIINLFIVDDKNTVKNIFEYKCSLKNMANLGQLLTKKIKITYK